MRWKSARLLCKAIFENSPPADRRETGDEVQCGHIWDELIEPDRWDDSNFECPECGGESGIRIPFANIATASYPDGTNNRFADIKERRKLEKQARIAKRRGDMTTHDAAMKEREKLKLPGAPRK